jgi:hypothetical protein
MTRGNEVVTVSQVADAAVELARDDDGDRAIRQLCPLAG